MREPVAVLADDLPCGLIGQPGRLGVAVTVRDGIKESTGKHVARAIGVQRVHLCRGHGGLMCPFQHDAALRTTREADGARQLAELLADRL